MITCPRCGRAVMSLAVDVICDGCGLVLASATSGKLARREAREDGTVQRGRKDYCAKCAKKRRDVDGPPTR